MVTPFPPSRGDDVFRTRKKTQGPSGAFPKTAKENTGKPGGAFPCIGGHPGVCVRVDA